MKLVALPAFADNVVWMLHDGQSAIVVDPGDAAPVTTALDAMGLSLAAILVTHHHPDHVGGVDALRPRLQGAVYGPARETIPAPFTPLADGDRVALASPALRFDVIDVPGHTAGHIAMVVQAVDPVNDDTGGASGADADADVDAGHAPWLFCGDTLFSAGCGRLFEGTPAQMHDSLQRLAALPDDTAVCCAHEYTLSNLAFAAAVEPHNAEVQAHIGRCRSLREQGQLTLPSTIGLERRINPFLRCSQPEVRAAARQHGASNDGAVEVLAALRAWKNVFR